MIKVLSLIIALLYLSYSAEIAEAGQTDAQVPHSIQVSLSITNCPSPSLIAPTGHSPAHVPQDKHASEITYAIS